MVGGTCTEYVDVCLESWTWGHREVDRLDGGCTRLSLALVLAPSLAHSPPSPSHSMPDLHASSGAGSLAPSSPQERERLKRGYRAWSVNVNTTLPRAHLPSASIAEAGKPSVTSCVSCPMVGTR